MKKNATKAFFFEAMVSHGYMRGYPPFFDPRREAARGVAELIELTFVKFDVRVPQHFNPLITK